MFYKKYKEALDFLLSLKEYYDEESSDINLQIYHSRLKEVYLYLGDYKNAYEHLEKEKEYESYYHNFFVYCLVIDFHNFWEQKHC
ncbi:MAG: hypothetical protein II956_09865 [Bacteroidales bacterium]|nr:hypothetical protein [Bacteroidales bacterium]